MPIEAHTYDGVYWSATLTDYDGPPAPCGKGMSREEAIDDLMEQLDVEPDSLARCKQHDDHIWLTVAGSNWAIRAIVHYPGWARFFLWRGYQPHIERRTVDWPKSRWPEYAEKAAELLKEQYRDGE